MNALKEYFARLVSEDQRRFVLAIETLACLEDIVVTGSKWDDGLVHAKNRLSVHATYKHLPAENLELYKELGALGEYEVLFGRGHDFSCDMLIACFVLNEQDYVMLTVYGKNDPSLEIQKKHGLK